MGTDKLTSMSHHRNTGSMTDRENQELEPGSALPVPPSLDGASPTSEADVEDTAEGPEFGDQEVVGKTTGPYEFGDDVCLVGGAELDKELDAGHLERNLDSSASQTGSRPDLLDAGNERDLSEFKASVLDSMVNQAILSAFLNDGLELP